MKIDINQDFEETFPNEVYLGFTLSQCLAAGSGIMISLIVALLLWKFFSIPLVESTYIAIPLMVPACAAGFFRYQGQSLTEMIREIRFSGKTERLICKAGEYQGRKERIYSLSKHDSVEEETAGKKRKKSRKVRDRDLNMKRNSGSRRRLPGRAEDPRLAMKGEVIYGGDQCISPV